MSTEDAGFVERNMGIDIAESGGDFTEKRGKFRTSPRPEPAGTAGDWMIYMAAAGSVGRKAARARLSPPTAGTIEEGAQPMDKILIGVGIWGMAVLLILAFLRGCKGPRSINDDPYGTRSNHLGRD